MTMPKIFSDTDAAALGDACTHNRAALKLAGRIAAKEDITLLEMRAHMAVLLHHLAQTQVKLSEMERIREANNPRRRKVGANGQKNDK